MQRGPRTDANEIDSSRTHAQQSDGQPSTIVPPQPAQDITITPRLIHVRQGVQTRVPTVVRRHELRQRRPGQREAHHEREVRREPDGGAPGVSADGVHVQVARVDVEVDPVEAEGLDQAQDGLPEEPGELELGWRRRVEERVIFGSRVQPECGLVLIQQGHDGVAVDERDEGSDALGLVLDVHSWFPIERDQRQSRAFEIDDMKRTG